MGRLLLICGNIFNLFSQWCFPASPVGGIFFASAFGVQSQGNPAPDSVKRSDTKRQFCLVGGVSSTASPHKGTAVTTGGLGVHNQSFTSSVFHLANRSKPVDVDCDDSALACMYSTTGSMGRGCEGFGPTGTTEGQG